MDSYLVPKAGFLLGILQARKSVKHRNENSLRTHLALARTYCGCLCHLAGRGGRNLDVFKKLVEKEEEVGGVPCADCPEGEGRCDQNHVRHLHRY